MKLYLVLALPPYNDGTIFTLVTQADSRDDATSVIKQVIINDFQKSADRAENHFGYQYYMEEIKSIDENWRFRAVQIDLNSSDQIKGLIES